MTVFDEKLRRLHEQMLRREKLAAVVADLRRQVGDLIVQEEELAVARTMEQADVDRLEGRTLAAFFYGLTGSKEERLEKERQEARAAAVRHDAVVLRLQQARSELEARQREWNALSSCEKEYQSVLEEKARAIKAAGSMRGAEILRLEEEVCRLNRQQKELREAVAAGNGARMQAERVAGRLSNAEGWGTWDMLGGGLIADLAKHSELDQAQGEVEQLQLYLDRFKTELADVTVYTDMRVQIDGFLRFADCFFDGLFADWAVMDRIHQAQNRVWDVQRQIDSVLARLDDMRAETERRQAQEKEKLDNLILNT